MSLFSRIYINSLYQVGNWMIKRFVLQEGYYRLNNVFLYIYLTFVVFPYRQYFFDFAIQLRTMNLFIKRLTRKCLSIDCQYSAVDMKYWLEFALLSNSFSFGTDKVWFLVPYRNDICSQLTSPMNLYAKKIYSKR